MIWVDSLSVTNAIRVLNIINSTILTSQKRDAVLLINFILKMFREVAGASIFEFYMCLSISAG